MAMILDPEILEERARNLRNLNGIKRVFVSLEPPEAPTRARLGVEFHNGNALDKILSDAVFSIAGGLRIKAGTEHGQVQVVATKKTANEFILRLTVAPIGDYSTYTLSVAYPNIDPIFSAIDFKFRPGCFNLNCAPQSTPAAPPPIEPVIDYLAKDYDSFKHVLITAMRARVPGWQPTSEADLDQVLIDLIAADADELSDFQDRVANEAYLTSARKRVSLARHARLMDYNIHQGNQASTWLALNVSTEIEVPRGFGAWTGRIWNEAGAVTFISHERRSCSPLLNELALYDWDGLVTALDIGALAADLALPAPLNPLLESDADRLSDLFLSGVATYLLIQEVLNPETGTVNGRDLHARQLLQLTRAEKLRDPMSGHWFVRVHWRPEDRLQRRYCFLTQCQDRPQQNRVSLFHGNLIPMTHGRPHETVFRAPLATLAEPDMSSFLARTEEYYDPAPWGVLCTLPQVPLAYRKTEPGGEVPPLSTLSVTVDGSAWAEQSDLIQSEADDEHFMVETDEYQVSRLRFGNDVNGRALPPGAAVTCRYQVGLGEDGNIGADALTGFDGIAYPELDDIRNPFDVTDGLGPEPAAEITRRAPEAYRQRQLRAVTLEDYAKRAEELATVAHAAARYAWTGSWRTVRIAIDPKGTTTLEETVRREIEDHLNAVRLIGEDLEVRPAQYVPLDIELRLCAHPDYWPADLDAVLQQELSDAYTPDGRLGFFHADNWSFGQPLYASQLIGRALAVTGVGRVLSVSLRRWQGQAGPTTRQITVAPDALPDAYVDQIAVTPFEIIQVANDPNQLERGRIQFQILGGRQ